MTQSANVREDDAKRQAVAERGDVPAPQIDNEADDVARAEDDLGRRPVGAVVAADRRRVEARDGAAVEHRRVRAQAVERHAARDAGDGVAVGVERRGRLADRGDVDRHRVGREHAEADEDLLMRQRSEGRRNIIIVIIVIVLVRCADDEINRESHGVCGREKFLAGNRGELA